MDSDISKDIHWPSIEFRDFNHAINTAIEKNARLVLLSRTYVTLETPLRFHNNGARLHILSLDNAPTERPTIASCAHSIFITGGKNNTLHLQNLNLVHNCVLEDKKLIGGAVLARHSSSVLIYSCSIMSYGGFGLWAVQKAKYKVGQSEICSIRRSGIVMFGAATALLQNCKISECAQHGICLRGNCKLEVLHSSIHRCGVRALYGYHKVNVTLIDVEISGTKTLNYAALEIRGTRTTEESGWKRGGSKLRSSSGVVEIQETASRCTISMRDCVIRDNAGPSYYIHGDVIKNEENCTVDDVVPGSGATFSDPEEEMNPPDETDAGTSSYRWEWEYDGGSVGSEWRPYSDDVSSLLNQAESAQFRSGENITMCSSERYAKEDLVGCTSEKGNATSIRVDIGGREYVIDLNARMQTNLDTQCVRRIRRRMIYS